MMKKWILRVLYAALVMGPVAAIADYTATTGTGSTVFAFVCSSTKICPATVLMDSTNVEKATAGNPLRVDPTGTTTQPVSAASLPLPTGASSSANQGTTTDAPAAVPTSATAASEIALLKALTNVANSATPTGANVIGQVGSTSQYPFGAVPITASATGTTAATTATLAASVSIKTYICGFSIRANATAAVTANSTVTGTVTGTLNYTQWTAPLASGLGITEQVFAPCIPSSAINTAIAVVSAPPGTGGAVSVSAWGYQL